ncbi:MAG: hypothetical protein E7035_03215 [Verrucomicrobiaceae bacterium]|nr:hypothetical protein [Verrucomicrobiaceae bacterium]
MIKREISNIIKDVGLLKQNPMYVFSLGNKELFHSNVLVWLFNDVLNEQAKEKLFKVLFGEKMPKGIKAIREKNHFDIFFKDKSTQSIFVIENKITSYPSQEQLKDYKNKVSEIYRGYNFSGTLLLFDCVRFMTSENSNWKIVYYSKIIKVLDGFNEFNFCKTSDRKHIKYLKNSYVEYLKFINSLIKNKKDIYDFVSNNHEYNFLEEVKLRDFYFKARMSRLQDFLQKYFKQNDYHYEFGFTRKDALISIWRNDFHCEEGFPSNAKDKSNKNKGCAGIQIQGGQIRYYVKLTQKQLDLKKFASANSIIKSSKKRNCISQKDLKNLLNDIGVKWDESIFKEEYIPIGKFAPDMLYWYDREKLKSYYSFDNIKNVIKAFFKMNPKRMNTKQ